MKANKAERWAWIEDWMKLNFCTDSLNSQFHEKYHQRFPEYKRKETQWGAQTVAQAMRDLSDMEKSGILRGERIKLGSNWQPGFSKFVVGYTLKVV